MYAWRLGMVNSGNLLLASVSRSVDMFLGLRFFASAYLSAVSALRAVSPFSTDGHSDEKKEFSGWKVKVEYTAQSSQGVPYHWEFWCIIDKEAEVVINSFEIPIL